MRTYDVVVIGGGPGGLAAAAAAKENGASQVLLLERENSLGGILNQCIHDGFGLIRYHKQLSGPEYALRAVAEAEAAGVEMQTGIMVTEVTENHRVTAVSRSGRQNFQAGAIVFATGCRERTRGAISIPGSRPAGIYTAGVAQNLINRRNLMIGRRVVILGSGDVGLIMARRLTLEGAEVLAVAEFLPEPGGLARNISQCLYDFGIPLYLRHTVSNIMGKQRVCAVELSEVDAQGKIIPDTARRIECDTLILSVGLIPENEVAGAAGVLLDEKTNGALTDKFLQTCIPGIFACGNARKVMDLADFVSRQGAMAGANAARFVRNQPLKTWEEGAGNTMCKGLPQPGSVTCTLCPNGCQITVTGKNRTEGNKCEKGHEFALQEAESPERILTTTMRVQGGSEPLIAVRSDRPVKLEELRGLVEMLRGKSCTVPVKAGEVLLENVGRNGVNVIAECSLD